MAHESVAAALAGYDRLVEVGIGTRTDVAATLAAAGKHVVATDLRPRGVPDGVRFVVDDVTDPAVEVYAGAEAIYGLNLPPELHVPTREVAGRVDATFLFTTLGGDEPAVDATPTPVGNDTLYRARCAPDPGDPGPRTDVDGDRSR